MTIRVLGRVDANHHLSAEVPESVAAGPVEVIIQVPESASEEPESEAWAAMIGQVWTGDLADITQDIYTWKTGSR